MSIQEAKCERDVEMSIPNLFTSTSFGGSAQSLGNSFTKHLLYLECCSWCWEDEKDGDKRRNKVMGLFPLGLSNRFCLKG